MVKSDVIIRIRESLKRKGMTQRDLAFAMGKKEAEISRWMNGRIGISEGNLQRLEDVLDTPLTNSGIFRMNSGNLRLGIIGTGSIAKRFAEDVAYVSNIYLAAAYNPDVEEARTFCDRFGICGVCDNVYGLLNISDAVYVASPYYTHYNYVLMALMAGKHVLCETPLTTTLKEASELYSIAQKKGLVLMPALKTAYSPSFFNIIKEAKSGVIGDIVDVTATVTTLLPQSVTVGFNNERLRDNTYYALLVILKLLGSEIKKTFVFKRTDESKILYLNATLEYEDAVAHVKAGTGVKSESNLVIGGTKGYIYVPAPWWKPDYFEIRYENPYDNKKLYFPFEASGLRYETQCFMDNIGLINASQNLAPAEMLKIIQLVEKILR